MNRSHLCRSSSSCSSPSCSDPYRSDLRRAYLRAALGALALAFFVCASALRAHAAEPQRTVQRFALVISSNDGGSERVRLRFADSDARAVAEVLEHLGGVQRSDIVLLTDATSARLKEAFDALRERLSAPRAAARRELFVYYSGHSDERGLLLGDERVGYRDLRRWVDGTRADVRIAVFDSCASGAVIRERGGVRRPPFLSDMSVDARGHAFLTASSADEAAQESDRIRGGFFTHYFLSGLRGAADTSRDGKVTLAEAYQFSYNETLRRTEQIGAKAQHPAYDIQLAGTGDLVLTDVRSTAATLTLEDELAGRVFVRDQSGRLMVELQKEPVYPVTLGLGPGRYRVTLDFDGSNYQTEVVLEQGKTVSLGQSELSLVRQELADARGAHARPRDEGRTPALIDPNFGLRKIGGYGGLSMRYANIRGSDTLLAGVELALLFDHRFAIGIAGYGGREDPPDSGATFGYGGVHVRYHFLFESSPFYLSIGALIGAGGHEEEPTNEEGEVVEVSSDDRDKHEDAVFVTEPVVSGHVNVTPWLRLGVDAGYRFVAGPRRLRPRDFDGPVFGMHAQVGWF